MSGGIFEGVRVIDCGSYIAGPAAATVMSDFGAEVIKVEPLTGDPYRTRNAPPKHQTSPTNPHWLIDSRNKKSLVLDLSRQEGAEALRKMVAEADVFITNYPPKVRNELGLTFEHMAKINPRLIHASFTGFGEDGPEANKPGFDATVWWARTGMMDIVRAGDSAPVRLPQGMGDHCSAMGFYGAIVTALFRRERTGLGAQVGSSLLLNGVWANACAIQTTMCGEEVERTPKRDDSDAPWRNVYRCADGKWLLLSIVHKEPQWKVFKSALNDPRLAKPEFQTIEGRKTNARELTDVLDAIFAEKPRNAWAALLDDSRVVFGQVASLDDVIVDPQVVRAGAIVETTDPSIRTVSSPFWIAGEEKVTPTPPPKLGEHTHSVLRSFNFDEDMIRRLYADGVVV